MTVSDAAVAHGHDDSHGHDAHDHWDPMANTMGMWLFLFTEVLLFGGLFLAFFVYFYQYTHDFRESSGILAWKMGCFNTWVLLTSSLTVALSIWALERGKKKLCINLLLITVAFAGVFMVVKYFEYTHKWEVGYYPAMWAENTDRNLMYTVTQQWLGGFFNPPVTADWPVGKQIYFGLYFTMTGLHGLHVIIGAGLILWTAVRVKNGAVTSERISFLENVGLYWHIVDVIWIFLFPMMYLIG